MRRAALPANVGLALGRFETWFQAKAPAPLPFYVDQDLCTECTMCVRVLGCPSILLTDGEYTIEEETCDGCDICAFVCKPGAIKRRTPVGVTL